MSWYKFIPRFEDGKPVIAKTFNAPLDATIVRLSLLERTIQGINASQALTLSGVPVDISVLAGHIVYFKAETGSHFPAKAGWSSLWEASGQPVMLPSAVIAGLVTNKTSSIAADIVFEGVRVLDSAALVNLFGTNTPDIGMYWLSDVNPGQVTKTRPGMAIAAVQYRGNGIVRVLPPSHEQLTHDHRSYTLLAADWISASLYPVEVRPAGALFAYNINSVSSMAQGISAVLQANAFASSYYLVSTGARLPSSNFVITPLTIWSNIAISGDIELVTSSVDAKGLSIVHSIASPDKSIEVKWRNGHVDLGITPLLVTANTNPTGFCIESITGPNALRAPVINKVTTGPGLRTDTIVPGHIHLSNDLLVSPRISAELVNLNNAIVGLQGFINYLHMPDTRTSSITGRTKIPQLGASDSLYQARTWMKVLSPAAASAPALVSYSVLPQLGPGNNAPFTAVVDTPFATLPTVPAGNVIYVESLTVIDLAGLSGGDIFLRLLNNEGNPTQRILDFGITVELKV